MNEPMPSELPTLPITRPEVWDRSRDDVWGELLGFARRHRLLVTATVLVSVALVGTYTMLVRPRYEGAAQLRIEGQEMNLPDLLRRVSQENQIATELEVLKSRALAAELVDSLGLRIQVRSPRAAVRHEILASASVSGADTLHLELYMSSREEFVVRRLPDQALLGTARVGEATTVGGVTFVLAPGAARFNRLELAVLPAGAAVEALQDALKIERVGREADMLVIGYRDSDPELARDVPNQLAARFIASRQVAHRVLASDAVAFLRRQVDTVTIQLATAESALERYRTATRSVALDEEARTQVGRLVQAEAERGQIAAEREALAALVAQGRAAPAPGSGE